LINYIDFFGHTEVMLLAPVKGESFYENENDFDIWGFVRTAFDSLWFEHTHRSPYSRADQHQCADRGTACSDKYRSCTYHQR
jgi:hypothetical protein